MLSSLDVMMPDMDGPTTFQNCRPILRLGIPVILLTAKVQASDRRRYADMGMSDRQTLQPSRLAGQVAEALGWSWENKTEP